MADKYIDIHGHKVKYDDSSDTIKNAVEHLAKGLSKDQAKVYFHEAEIDTTSHKADFQVRNHKTSKDNNLTLYHETDGTYHLKKRAEHFF